MNYLGDIIMAQLDLQASILSALEPVANGNEAAIVPESVVKAETDRIVKAMATKRQKLKQQTNKGVFRKIWDLIGSTTSLATTGLYVANEIATAEATVFTATYEQDRMLSSLKDRLELLKEIQA
jgi:hypothetical protein